VNYEARLEIDSMKSLDASVEYNALLERRRAKAAK
jgi:hypothetical protein